MTALILLILVIAVLAAVITGELRRLHGAMTASGAANRDDVPAVGWDPERIAIYVLSLAGLVAMLYGIAGLLATVVVTITEQSNTVVSAADVRDRTSYYLASLVVGLPIWAGLWALAQRRTARSRIEQQAPERRLYLAAVFGIASVIALFGLHTSLRVFFVRLGGVDGDPPARDGVFAAVRMAVWAMTWLLFARTGWRERSPKAKDELHDLAVFALSGCSLGFLVLGLYGTIVKIIAPLFPSSAGGEGTGISASSSWGEVLAWLIAGAVMWVPIWRYDLRRGSGHRLRGQYLYVVLVPAVFATLGELVYAFYNVLLWIFGDRPANAWSFLRGTVPIILLGSSIWIYHWAIVRRQNVFWKQLGAVLPWPRRPGLALLALGGLATLAVAWLSLLWLGLDSALHTSTALSGGDWWRSRVSICVAAGVVGSVTWFIAWSILQRAAGTGSLVERAAAERRRLLVLAAIGGALVAIGFTVALLWTLFRALLGGSMEASTLDRALKDLCTVLAALSIAGYHGMILRTDRRATPATPKRKMRVLALVAPGAEGILSELGAMSGQTLEVIGRLTGEAIHDPADLRRLEEQLQALETAGAADGAVLILRGSGISLHPYVKRSTAEQAVSSVAPEGPQTKTSLDPSTETSGVSAT